MNTRQRTLISAAAKSILDAVDSSGRQRQRSKKRSIKRSSPVEDSNVGMIYAHLLARQNKRVKSAALEKLLLNRREAGERSSGDAASVSSDVNYLKKYYGYDIEVVEPGVYVLHHPKRKRT